MLSIFKKKSKQSNKVEINKLMAYTSGKVIPISEVDDKVFSTKMLGDGVGIIPNNNEVLAPYEGEITVTMDDTKHAVGMKLVNGIELLFHVGIDTVSMGGEGFNIHVSTGQKVKTGEKLISFNKELIKSKGLQDTVIMVITNGNEFEDIEFYTDKEVTSNKDIIAIIGNN